MTEDCYDISVRPRSKQVPGNTYLLVAMFGDWVSGALKSFIVGKIANEEPMHKIYTRRMKSHA